MPLPLDSTLIDPTFSHAERFRFDTAGPNPPDFGRTHETGLLEYFEMLHHGRQRHGQWSGEVADRGGSQRELRQHRATRRIGECLEGEVE